LIVFIRHCVQAEFRNQVLPARGILADKSIIMCGPNGVIENLQRYVRTLRN